VVTAVVVVVPVHLRQTDINFEQFKRLLKTFRFECRKRDKVCLIVKPYLTSFSFLTDLHSCSKGLVWLIGAVVCLLAVARVQLFVDMDTGQWLVA